MKKSLFALVVLCLLQACSDDDTTGSVTKAQCDQFGGNYVNGQCQKEVDPAQMKSICESQGMEYWAEHNACIQK